MCIVHIAPVASLSICLLAGMGCGTTTTTMARATLTVHNQSMLTICDVHLTETGAPDPRPNPEADRLPPDQQLDPGESHSVEVAAGRYDLRLDDCRNAALYSRRNLALEGEQTIYFRPVEVQRDPRFGTRRYARPAQGRRSF